MDSATEKTAWEVQKQQTHEAMLNPKVGDRFQEMYAHWVYVVKVTKKYVWTLAASVPCEFPKDGVLKKRTKEQFIEYYSYTGNYLKSPHWAYDDIDLRNQYWIEICDRGNNVEGWII